WQSEHFEGPDWADRASRTSAASSSPRVSASPTCARRVTSSRSRWRPRPTCPRCGSARGAAPRRCGATVSVRSRRPRSRPGPTGTCCWSGGRSRSSRRSWPSGSSCSGPARSARRTCIARTSPSPP
ncbi:MAG: FIG00820327: hypothetical protein, partial [uncultured Nocardioidaceae bacterium]